MGKNISGRQKKINSLRKVKKWLQSISIKSNEEKREELKILYDEVKKKH